jgi:hypothetical protein
MISRKYEPRRRGMSHALGAAVVGSPDALVVDVRQDVDVFLARAEARNLAGRSGFSGSELEEIARLAAALASHVIQRRTVGALHLRSVRDGKQGPGIIIMTIDRGPPIPNLRGQSGLEDTADGSSLASARRLSHSLTHEVKDGSNIVCAARWVCAPERKITR